MRKYIITGRDNSGKSTFKKEIDLIVKDLSKINKTSFIELHGYSANFTTRFNEEDSIVLIDTPALICFKRSGKVDPFNDEQQNEQDRFLFHVTELPRCTIISNNGTLDEFRVRIKKFIKSL